MSSNSAGWRAKTADGGLTYASETRHDILVVAVAVVALGTSPTSLLNLESQMIPAGFSLP